MTCVVGLVDEEGTVFIGADSASLGGWELSIRKDPKVFRNGDFLIGFTSSWRMGQLLRYAFVPPAYQPSVTLNQILAARGEEGVAAGHSASIEAEVERYMATVWVDAVRQCLKDGGYAKKTNEEESGGTFLVGFRGRLFLIDSDYQVGEALCGYHAVGCGAQAALGALHVTTALNLEPARRIERALQAAEAHNAGVRGPFVIEELRHG